MAEAALVGPEIEAGSWLVGEIRKAGIDLRSAAWVYDVEKNRWRLHLVAPWPVGLDGNPYRSLTRFFGFGIKPDRSAMTLSGKIRLEDVVPHSPDSRYARALERLEGTADESSTRVRDRYVEGVFFPEAVVYKLAA